MRKPHVAVTITLLLALTSGLWAQDTAAEAPAESVLKHIPAGATGYVVVNNVQNTVTKIEKFMTSIGAMPPPPEDAPPVSMILQMLRQQAKLGDGFNPNAGAAVVLLDLKQFGINLPNIALSGITGKELDEKDAKALAAGFPFVLYVPGKSLSKVFGNYKIVTENQEFATVELRMGKMFAGRAGSYILLSPNKDALKAVMLAKKKTGDELSKAEAAIVARNDIAYHVDFKLISPTVTALINTVGKQAAAEDPSIGPILNIYFSLITQLFEQLDSEAGGIRLDKTGIVVEALDVAKVGTMMAKTWAAMGKTTSKGASVLDSLPSLPYVLAVGGSGAMGAGGEFDFMTKLIDDVMAIEPLKTKLTAETKAKTKKTIAGLMEQVTEVQFVGGGAPAGNGMFGLAWSIKCKDSAKLKALIADKAALAQTFITTLIDDKDAKDLKIIYSKGVEKAGDVSIDAIEISHPELLKMKEKDRTEMSKVLGEDKIRFLIAAPDKQTVVVTFAGSTAMTAKAIATAAGKGPIPNAPGTAAAMEVLPKDPNMLVFLNVANLLDVIRTGMASTVEDPEARQKLTAFIPELKCKTPIAIGAKTQDNTAHSVIYVPTALIREIVPKIQQMVGMFMMGAMGGGMQEAPAEQKGAAPPAGDF
ncbi:MAG: hypothetical protein QGH60_09395 [Phycisphaerae bacterium]|jgi:hypothetical protein|nr:hypothetical protein [Phycisphaerae bacterium]